MNQKLVSAEDQWKDHAEALAMYTGQTHSESQRVKAALNDLVVYKKDSQNVDWEETAHARERYIAGLDPKKVSSTEFPVLRTKGDVYKLPQDVLARMMKDKDKGLPAIEAALAATPDNPVVTPEEIAAQEQAAKEAAEKAAADAASAEAARVAAEQEAAKRPAETAPKPWEAEDTKNKETFERLGISVVRDDQGNITKVIQNFQVKDETGKPVGRPTHFETPDLVGLLLKNNESYTQAVRAFDRLKSQKVSFKNQPQQPEAELKELSEAELLSAMEDVKSSDKAKALAAIRKIAGSDLAKERQAAREAQALAEGQRIGYEFMKAHPEFNPCQANSDIIGKYLEDNSLAYTRDNLEIAYLAKENELAPVIPKEPVRPTPPVVNPPVPASPAAQPAAPVVPAVVAPPAAPATPASPAVPANPELPAARPGVNGVIAPGSLSGTKPAVTPGKLTKADILTMAKKEPAKFKRMVADPKSRAEMNAILAQQG